MAPVLRCLALLSLLIAQPGSVAAHIGSQHGKPVSSYLAAGQTKMVWLHDSIQDFGLQFWFRCESECRLGVVFGMQEEATHLSGTYAAISGATPALAGIMCGANGGNLNLRPLPPAVPAAFAFINPLPPPKVFPPPPGHPLSVDDSKASVFQGEWNHVELRVVGGAVQLFLNNRIVRPLEGQPLVSRLGKVGLLFQGVTAGDMALRDVSLSDFTVVRPYTPDHDRPGFHVQRLASGFAGYGESVADVNGDGIPDVIAGKTYFLGPDFTVARQIEDTRPMDPGGYAVGMPLSELVADFTKDGRPDIFMTTWPAGGPARLYVNPGNLSARWPSSEVIPQVDGEIVLLADLYGDGKKEVVYAADGTINAARPSPESPASPWIVQRLTQAGPWGNRNSHGLGIGDINGDGRPDILSAWGWWEQPAGPQALWVYHPEAFGRSPTPGNPGGAQMYAYDVNGDGLADVITSLEAHGRGLAWFEQRRDAYGAISFRRHMIMDLDPSRSHGVTFSELHSLALADMDGDGLLDIVTGKSNTNVAHWNTFGYVDSDAAPVLYWFKLVRHPGGDVDFVPHLISDQSGAGRQTQLVDLDGDGRPDVVVNTRQGVFVFHNKMGRARAKVNPRSGLSKKMAQ